MSGISDIPFNVAILDLNQNKLRGITPITSMDDFEGNNTNNFNDNGLFSTTIFGKVGDESRNKRFSYIDIKIPVFHPIIYKTLVELKQLYAGIISGTDYAVWDNKEKDFVRAGAITGRTGFAFFLEHWEEIKFKKTNSDIREERIKLIEKYKGVSMTSNVIVIPAGLRDIEVQSDGRIQKDEINDYYYRLMSIANTISEAAIRTNPEILNVARLNMQNTFNEMFETLENMVKGKKKLMLGKWASRRIFNGTRNVITAMNTSTAYLGSPNSPGMNKTMICLYQALKCVLPVSIHMLKTGFLSKVFMSPGLPARLVNKKTLKLEEVNLRPEYFDRFATDEGLEKVITKFQEEDIRDIPIEIEGHYLGLIYKGPDGTFKLIQSIDEVPNNRSIEDVKPLTFCELVYLSVYKRIDNFPGFLTRYPITGPESCYPSFMQVKTTLKTEVRYELNDQWEPIADSAAYEFPIAHTGYMNSMTPHSSKLAGLGADFDGDMCSFTAVYADESIDEIKKYLTTRNAYIGSDGNFKYSTGVDTVNLVVHNLTA